MFVKLLNNRLSEKLTAAGVLRGLNYAGLKNEDVRNPITTLLNVMEDAKEEKKSYGSHFRTWLKPTIV